MRRAQLPILALHLLVLVLPVLGLVLRAPDAKLFGTEPPSPFPHVTLSGWRDESVQAQLKAWFESHLGFRGVLVRTDNSLLYATLGETKPEAVVKRGDDGVLFINDDIWYAALRVQDRPSADVLHALAAQIARAQRELALRNKQLIVILAPTKGSLYGDDLPPRWRRRDQTSERTDTFVERTLRADFAAEGVHYGDGISILQSYTGPREIIYPRVARHWSRVGACLALRQAARPVLNIPSCDYVARPASLEWDGNVDLYRLLNTWHLTEPLPTVFELVDGPPAPPNAPRAVFVGSSFTWLLVDAARPYVREAHVLYYNSSVYDASTPRPRLIGPLDPAAPEWARYVLDKDVYVIEVLESYASSGLIQGFLKTLLERL